MDFWKKMTNNEKAMLGVFLFLIIMVALSWGRISEGFKKGVEPYNKEVKTERNE